MSIEEHARAIEERLDWLATYHVYDDEAVDFLQCRIQDIIDALKWIPVSERLPDNKRSVKVRKESGHVITNNYGRIFDTENQWLFESEKNPIVAWRELV